MLHVGGGCVLRVGSGPSFPRLPSGAFPVVPSPRPGPPRHLPVVVEVVTWPLAPAPPCEQVLAAVGGGCWGRRVLPPSPSLQPQTTLQAVARRRGCVGAWVPCRSLVVVLPPRPVVFVPLISLVVPALAPRIHPVSSRSRRWWGVPVVVGVVGRYRCVSSSPHRSRRRGVVVVSLLPLARVVSIPPLLVLFSSPPRC